MMFSALVQGYLKPGMAVPSSRDLAEQLGVGRNTVTIAYQQLVAERILESKQRSGHFVCLNFQIDSSESKTIRTTSKATTWGARFCIRPSAQRHSTTINLNYLFKNNSLIILITGSIKTLNLVLRHISVFPYIHFISL